MGSTAYEKVFEVASKRFAGLTRVQLLSFEPIYKGLHTVICSETGSGKTEAALLPLFAKLLEKETTTTKVVYITPLRALNRDIEERIRWLASELKITVGLLHGDTPSKTRLYLRQNPPATLITTPESFQALISQPQSLASLMQVEHVVIDEANELIQSKRGVQLSLALARFRAYLGRGFQTICLSATMRSTKLIQDFFIGSEATVVYLEPTRRYRITVDAIENYNKIDALKQKLNRYISGKTIIFVNTRHLSESLAKTLGEQSIEIHHSSLSRSKRTEVENALKRGELRAVIATSSLELGIDVGLLERVVQVGSPRSVETLAQRLGRSGHRVDLESVGAIVAFNPFDLLESIACAILLKSNWLEKPKIYRKPLDVLANQIVAHLLIKRKATKSEILELARSAHPYRDLSEEELDAVLGFLERNRQVSLRGENILVGSRSKSYFYSNLSTIVSLQQYRVRDTASRRTIGMLDGDFVERNCDTGRGIVLGKNVWEIVSIDYGQRVIEVKQRPRGDAVVPSWSGDTLPVDPYVSQRATNLIRSKTRREALEKLELTQSARKVLNEIPRVVLEHNSVTIVGSTKGLVLFAPFGTRGNKALAILVEELLGEQGILCKAYSTSIGVLVDTSKIGPRTLQNMLVELDTEKAAIIVRGGASKYGRFTDRFFNVARRFGVDVDRLIEKYGAKRTHLMLSQTIIAQEALNEIFTDLLDLLPLQKALSRKRIRVYEEEKARRLAELFVESFFTAPGATGESADLADIVKRRIENKAYFCVCLSCFKYSTTIKVGELKDGFRCPKCGSRYLGFVSPRAPSLSKAINALKNNAKAADEETERTQNELVESANIYLDYGKKGIIVLSGYGVGPRTAKNILSMPITDERQLYMEILKAEQEYIRTREFWG